MWGGLDAIIGLMDPIVGFLQNILAFFYDFTGNYGLSILLLTLVIKAVTWPLTQKQLESTQKMQALEPQKKKLQEKLQLFLWGRRRQKMF